MVFDPRQGRGRANIDVMCVSLCAIVAACAQILWLLRLRLAVPVSLLFFFFCCCCCCCC